ncbi:MAG: nucleoside hydrolase [Anaerolineae bacterium]|nr:nucleoside hydrolase [Anaerolineae bacterium]
MPQKVILDVDTGTDDAVALMCAALHPDLELVAATTVNGNVPVRNCTENTLRVFDYLGLSVPVYEGLSKPFVRPDFPTPRSQADPWHGEYLDLPAATTNKQDQSAIDFLVEYYMGPDGPSTTLVPVGPLSNIAMAIRMEPRLVERIPEMVIMGGAHLRGNVTPSAEFNIWTDPEGARVVFQSGIPMRVATYDATWAARTDQAQNDLLRAVGTPAATAAATFCDRRIRYNQFHETAVNDALAVLAIVDPALLVTKHVYADVETFGELTLGRTVFDTHGRSGKTPNCHVALDADRDRFNAMLRETLSYTV